MKLKEIFKILEKCNIVEWNKKAASKGN